MVKKRISLTIDKKVLDQIITIWINENEKYLRKRKHNISKSEIIQKLIEKGIHAYYYGD